MLKLISVAVLAVGLSSPAFGGETMTYSYDVLGRLVGTAHLGSINSGLQGSIAYDAADNRTNYPVTGSASSVSLSISDAYATEGGNLNFTVTRAGSSASSTTVNYATSNGTATAGSDYTTTSGTLTFAPGETSKTITVATIDDSTAETSERLTVTLSNPNVGVTLTDTTATGTINDNDVTAISFAVGNAPAVDEGGTLIFTITKTGSTSATTSVQYATANGSATSGGKDYTPAAGTLTFAASETSKTVSVMTLKDAAQEPTETVLPRFNYAEWRDDIGASGFRLDQRCCGTATYRQSRQL